MNALAKRFFTPEEYLELENAAEYKSQFVDGEIFAMAGGGRGHNEVLLNIITELNSQFRGRSCRVYFQDIRLRVAASGLYTYPDAMALCGEPKFEGKPGDPPSLLNPAVIFEVLSPSTQAFDRGDKFTRYRRLQTLRDYVLVSARDMRVEHHHLRDDGVWTYLDHRAPESIVELASVGCELTIAEIYERVTFPSAGGQ